MEDPPSILHINHGMLARLSMASTVRLLMMRSANFPAGVPAICRRAGGVPSMQFDSPLEDDLGVVMANAPSEKQLAFAKRLASQVAPC